MAEPIINRVKANTKLVTIDLADFAPTDDIVSLDIKSFLHMGLLLKEQDFRNDLANYDWEQYQGKVLCVFCSTEAIIAPWAWMLITTFASEHAKDVMHLEPDTARHQLFERALNDHNWSLYEGKFVLLKGCGDVHVPDSVYVLATNKLLQVARKIMYGEACSFVPVYKG
ncbi:MAG: DUF2480 family protein [Bacteroidota bacterium]